MTLVAFAAVSLLAGGPSSTQSWLAARLAAARAGTAEIVRLPLAHDGNTGVSCFAVEWSVAAVASSACDDALGSAVVPEFAAGVAPPRWFSAVVAEGVFPGESRRISDGERQVDAPVFRVLRTRPLGSKDDAQPAVVASGDLAASPPPASDGGTPWLAVVDSIPLAAADAKAQAEALRRRLVDAGFTGAEILDGRTAPRLFCCFDVVAAGRFADRSEVTARVAALKAKGFPRAYERCAFAVPACADADAPGAACPAADDESAVWSAALAAFPGWDPETSAFVVGTATTAAPAAPAGAALPADALRDLASKPPRRLDRCVVPKAAPTRVSRTALPTRFGSARPDEGEARVSRVGFDAERRVAVVYVDVARLEPGEDVGEGEPPPAPAEDAYRRRSFQVLALRDGVWRLQSEVAVRRPE